MGTEKMDQLARLSLMLLSIFGILGTQNDDDEGGLDEPISELVSFEFHPPAFFAETGPENTRKRFVLEFSGLETGERYDLDTEIVRTIKPTDERDFESDEYGGNKKKVGFRLWDNQGVLGGGSWMEAIDGENGSKQWVYIGTGHVGDCSEEQSGKCDVTVYVEIDPQYYWNGVDIELTIKIDLYVDPKTQDKENVHIDFDGYYEW